MSIPEDVKTELKPCPFCGGKFKLSQEPHDNHPVAGMYYIYHDYGPLGSPARECRLDITGHFHSEKEAVDFWNRRAILTDREARTGWSETKNTEYATRLHEYKNNPHHINPMSQRFQSLLDEVIAYLSSGADQTPSPYRAPSPSLRETEGEKEIVPIANDSLQARIGEVGNQIHNIGCEHQNDDELCDRLGALSTEIWELSKLSADASALLLEAERALEPFAEHASEYDEESDQQQVWPTFEIGAFRAARSTLAKIRGRE